jgi:preprotein translocase subunit Sss1
MSRMRRISRTEQTPSPTSSPEEEEDKLTSGQITGIVLMSVGGLGLLILIIMLIAKSGKKSGKKKR